MAQILNALQSVPCVGDPAKQGERRKRCIEDLQVYNAASGVEDKP